MLSKPIGEIASQQKIIDCDSDPACEHHQNTYGDFAEDVYRLAENLQDCRDTEDDTDYIDNCCCHNYKIFRKVTKYS